jgi:hypothetical protein
LTIFDAILLWQIFAKTLFTGRRNHGSSVSGFTGLADYLIIIKPKQMLSIEARIHFYGG